MFRLRANLTVQLSSLARDLGLSTKDVNTNLPREGAFAIHQVCGGGSLLDAISSEEDKSKLDAVMLEWEKQNRQVGSGSSEWHA